MNRLNKLYFEDTLGGDAPFVREQNAHTEFLKEF